MKKYLKSKIPILLCLIIALMFIPQTAMGSWVEVDDESGVTLANSRIIAKTTEAAIRLDGLDLTTYSSENYRIVLHDGTYEVWGWIGVADAAEALAADILGGKGAMDDDTYWSLIQAPWLVDDGGSGIADIDGSQAVYKYIRKDSLLTEHRLYKHTFDVANRTAGGGYIHGGYAAPGIGKGVEYTVDGSYTGYHTANGTTTDNSAVVYLFADADFDGDVDDWLVKQVTALGTDGVHIYTTRGYTTQSWNGDDVASFDWNAITAIEIEQERSAGSLVPSLGLDLRSQRYYRY